LRKNGCELFSRDGAHPKLRESAKSSRSGGDAHGRPSGRLADALRAFDSGIDVSVRKASRLVVAP